MDLKGDIMHNNSRIYVLSGSASGIGRATKELLVSQGHRVIGVDLREDDVIADSGTPAGRDLMIDQVTEKSRGKVDALLAVAGVDIAGPSTIAINYYGALATLEGLRHLLLKSSAPRAVAAPKSKRFGLVRRYFWQRKVSADRSSKGK
jgi:NAD(P)-dependent dehydrogenase (short-subunit alcohol dehydrogenase family)